MMQIALPVPLFYPRTGGVATAIFLFRKPKRRCRRKVDFVLQEIASVVRCNAGCGNEEHRAAVDRESRVNDVAKNA